MWPFKKKKKEEEADDSFEDDDDESEEDNKPAEDAALAQKVEMMAADITKINGNVESLKEMRKSTSERFSTINEQIGELRGTMNDTQRTVGMIEVKATKAADLVESVHPDKLMIQVQKEDGKIEGLRGMLEAKEEMIKNALSQVKKLRDQVNIFRGVEQVIKLNEEVKDELMNVKKIVANVERHADRVDNVFLESQKSFQAFNTFNDKLDTLKAEQKAINTKIDKMEVAIGTFIKKKEFETKIEKIEKHDKEVKKVLDEVKKYYKMLDERFMEMKAKIRGEFEYKIEKAEILSKAFDDLLRENPLFSNGLKLQDYLNKHMESASSSAEVKSEEKKEESKDAEKKEGEDKGGEEGGASEGDKKEGEGEAKEEGDKKKEEEAKEEPSAEEKKEESKEEGESKASEEKPDEKLTEGMTDVKKEE